MPIDPRLHRIVAAQPYPLLFATISGAHLYGFPSPDSDYDLRGAHVLPLDAIVGLEVRDETVQDSRVIDGLEMDIVSHDANFNCLKVSPVFYQTDAQMEAYLAEHNLPNEWDYFDPAKADDKRECGLHAAWGGQAVSQAETVGGRA